jgi:hypothetical protein
MDIRRRALALVPFALLAACSGTEATRSCESDLDCGAPGEAHCDAGICVANGPPAVSVRAPSGPLLTHTLLRFTAAVSEPEAEDVAVAWSVAPLSAGCAGDVDALAGDPPAADAALWCAGTYEITATATDPWGHSSAASAVVSVSAAQGAPAVAATGAAAATHRCSGDPLACEAVGPGGATTFSLAASGTGGALTYGWTALPPERAPAATASFSPAATVPNPTVAIGSAGTPIAGPWRFRVRVLNELGLIAQAVVVVDVGNRPPSVTAPGFASDHRYDPAARRYVVETVLAPTVVDPDGDPVSATFEVSESPPSGCSVELTPDAPPAVRLVLSCADPASLLDVERSVVVAADDGNGGSQGATAPLEVRNRAPQFALVEGGAVTPALSVAHSVGACAAGGGSCYLVHERSPVVASDPDGDPLPAYELSAEVGPSSPQSYGRAWRDAGGAPWYEFGTPAPPAGDPAQFRGVNGESAFRLRARVQDPFGTEATAAIDLVVQNRPPAITAPASTTLAHQYDRGAAAYLAGAVVGGAADPDGDPVALAFEGDASCATSRLGDVVRAECAWPSHPAAQATHPFTLTGSDGWDSVSAATALAVTNGAPVPEPATVQACECVCDEWDTRYPDRCVLWVWAASGPVTVPVVFSEPEGDPVLVAGSKTCYEPGCSVTATASPSFTIRLWDGVAASDVPVTASCPLAPAVCK